MSDLDEAKRLLEKIADANKTELGNTDVTYVTLALEICSRITLSVPLGKSETRRS